MQMWYRCTQTVREYECVFVTGNVCRLPATRSPDLQSRLCVMHWTEPARDVPAWKVLHGRARRPRTGRRSREEAVHAAGVRGLGRTPGGRASGGRGLRRRLGTRGAAQGAPACACPARCLRRQQASLWMLNSCRCRQDVTAGAGGRQGRGGSGTVATPGQAASAAEQLAAPTELGVHGCAGRRQPADSGRCCVVMSGRGGFGSKARRLRLLLAQRPHPRAPPPLGRPSARQQPHPGPQRARRPPSRALQRLPPLRRPDHGQHTAPADSSPMHNATGLTRVAGHISWALPGCTHHDERWPRRMAPNRAPGVGCGSPQTGRIVVKHLHDAHRSGFGQTPANKPLPPTDGHNTFLAAISGAGRCRSLPAACNRCKISSSTEDGRQGMDWLAVTDA